MATLRRLENISARFRASRGDSVKLERKVVPSIHKRVVCSRVATSAERPKLSARLISPTTSPGPSKARITSAPSPLRTHTFTDPATIT
jgi:hypothetical protein